MPYINIQIVKDGNTQEQKDALVRGTTQLIVDVLGRRPDSVFVVIDEVDQGNWGIGYDTIATRRSAADEENR